MTEECEELREFVGTLQKQIVDWQDLHERTQRQHEERYKEIIGLAREYANRSSRAESMVRALAFAVATFADMDARREITRHVIAVANTHPDRMTPPC